MSDVQKGWSCSTLMAGVAAIGQQDAFLRSTSDEALEREYAAPTF